MLFTHLHPSFLPIHAVHSAHAVHPLHHHTLHSVITSIISKPLLDALPFAKLSPEFVDLIDHNQCYLNQPHQILVHHLHQHYDELLSFDFN